MLGKRTIVLKNIVFLVFSLLLICAVSYSAGASAGDSVSEVAKRVAAVVEPSERRLWPVSFENSDSADINAYATTSTEKMGKVVVTRGLLEKLVENNDDLLAFIIGHEIAHIVLGHVSASDLADDTPFLRAAYTRQQEVDADRKGMELAVAAGYSYQRCLKGIRRAIELGLDYSAFEGLSTDHPSWTDRLALLDKEQGSIWRAMSAFDLGNLFLSLEQYYPAERCFRRVTKEFPSCSEAWANMGYALLMQYCDALEVDDLRKYDVGQIVCGGFYRRPASLEAQLRGINEEVWWEAVGALREALRLSPDLVLPKANLGIAYLISPAGKDVGHATKYLEEAAEQTKLDTMLDSTSKAAVLINACVAQSAGGQTDRSTAMLQAAQDALKISAEKTYSSQSSKGLIGTIAYNRAVLASSSSKTDDQTAAMKDMESYLRSSSPASLWWPLCYERYSALCTKLGVTAKAKDSFAQDNVLRLRPVTTVDLPEGHSITLTQPIKDVEEQLGKPDTIIPLVSGTSLSKCIFSKLGIELIISDQVIAIKLLGNQSGRLSLQGTGLGSEKQALMVGSTKDEVERILVDLDYDFRQIDSENTNYRFYQDIGIAVRIKDGKVLELVVAQIPQRSIPGSM